MIFSGLGVGPLPIHVAERDVQDGQLWQVPPYKDLPAIDVYLVWSENATKNRAEQILIDRLIAEIDKTPIEQRSYR
mgnify:FL=1